MQMHHAYKKDEFYSTLTHRAGVVGYFFPLTVIYQKCLQIREFLPAIFDGISAQNILSFAYFDFFSDILRIQYPVGKRIFCTIEVVDL